MPVEMIIPDSDADRVQSPQRFHGALQIAVKGFALLRRRSPFAERAGDTGVIVVKAPMEQTDFSIGPAQILHAEAEILPHAKLFVESKRTDGTAEEQLIAGRAGKLRVVQNVFPFRVFHKLGAGFGIFHPVALADHRIPGAVLFQHAFAQVRLHPVIAVTDQNDVSPGSVQPGVSGRGYASVGFIYDPDPAVRRRVFPAKGQGFIPGAVVYQQNFQKTL